jgi:uncharacterized membrane protein
MATAIIFAATFLVIAFTVALGRGDHDTYRTPQWAIAVHLVTALPALPLGAFVLLRRKGDLLHHVLGRVWATLMMITAVDAFWIRQVTGHIGPIHVFSVITLIAVPRGIYCIATGNVEGHRKAMLYSYVGLCSAFVFALRPGLLVYDFLFR